MHGGGGGMCGRGCARQGACMAEGGVCMTRRHAWQGTCVVGGMCGRGGVCGRGHVCRRDGH